MGALGRAVVEAAVLAACARPAAAGHLYVQSDSYFGDDFFKLWSFFDDEDPTHGAVEYVGREVAVSTGLVNWTREGVYIGVDMRSWPKGKKGRRSVRIQSNKLYNSGLFVAALSHVPTGCGTWPALWLFGGDARHPWPAWGEFDIVEGAHKSTQVMTTLHTSEGCKQSSVAEGKDFATQWNKGVNKKLAMNCDVHAKGQWENQGCSQAGPENSMGDAFNSFNGGTFASEWDPVAGHIRSWFWPAGSEPFDVELGHPDPSSWGKPYSYFRLDPVNCPASHFRNMRIVIDNTFCGEYGGATFEDACPEVLADHLTCEEFVLQHPEKMREAYWLVRGLYVYHPASFGSSGLIDVLQRFRTGALGVLQLHQWTRAVPQALLGSVVGLGAALALVKVVRIRLLRGTRREMKLYSQVELEL